MPPEGIRMVDHRIAVRKNSDGLNGVNETGKVVRQNDECIHIADVSINKFLTLEDGCFIDD